MAPVTAGFPASDFCSLGCIQEFETPIPPQVVGCMGERMKVEFENNEILWLLALCALAEKEEFPHITLPYKTRGALVLSDGKWGIVPIKMREMFDEQNRAGIQWKRSGADG